MMQKIVTMVFWNRHLLSRHHSGAMLLGVSLAFVPVASTANSEIAHHHPKYLPTTTKHRHHPCSLRETVAAIHN
jgi:hypothetical protein